MRREELDQRINDRRADHLNDGPLSRACFDARCPDCGLTTCTCGCHHPHCPRCGSRSVHLSWAAMDSSDFDSWRCMTCDKRWAGA